MIVGVGVDIVDVGRIKRIIQDENGARFIDRTFSKREQKYCKKFKDPYPRFAGRFAVKEAFLKAATTILKNISLREIETVNSRTGAPSIAISKDWDKRERYEIHVSISHTESLACAFVVIEKKEEK